MNARDDMSDTDVLSAARDSLPADASPRRFPGPAGAI